MSRGRADQLVRYSCGCQVGGSMLGLSCPLHPRAHVILGRTTDGDPYGDLEAREGLQLQEDLRLARRTAAQVADLLDQALNRLR